MNKTNEKQQKNGVIVQYLNFPEIKPHTQWRKKEGRKRKKINRESKGRGKKDKKSE